MEYFDVVLINPPWTKLGEGLESLGLGYIAAFLRRDNIKVKIVDAPLNDWSASRTIEEMSKIDCKLIGVSVPYQDAAVEIMDFASNLKKSKMNTHITLGGIYPSFAYEELLTLYPCIDSIVIGEGEETTVELARAVLEGRDYSNIKGISYRLGDKIVKTDTRPSIDDLDSLPLPERDTINLALKKYNFSSIISSRGCYARCSFCSVVPYYSEFGQRYRMRSAENVLKEIDYLHDNFGVTNIMFNDANFIGGSERAKERARKIAEGIIEKNLDLEFRIQCRVNDVDEELFALLKRAGLTRVYLGIESGSQTVLDRFRKDATVKQNIEALKTLSKLDIFVSMGFIMFDDRMTFNELSENIAFLNNAKKIVKKDKMGPVYPLSKLLPLSGTEIEAYMKENNIYMGNSLNYSYDFKDPVIRNIYKLINGASNLVWPVKKIFVGNPNADKTWTGGWRETFK